MLRLGRCVRRLLHYTLASGQRISATTSVAAGFYVALLSRTRLRLVYALCERPVELAVQMSGSMHGIEDLDCGAECWRSSL